MRIRTLLLAALLVLTHCIFGQTAIRKPICISAQAGIFQTGIDYFKETFESDKLPCGGIGLGMPLPKNFYLTGRALYAAKSGTPKVNHYTFDTNGQVISTTQSREGSADFNQWLAAFGLSYEFPINEQNMLNCGVGISYTKITEKIKTDQFSSDVKTDGIFGYYLGAGWEYKFSETPFSAIINGQYDFTRDEIIYFNGNLGGLTACVGVKFYLKRDKQN